MRPRTMTPAAVAGAAYLAMSCSAFAASHREAPLIAMDPSADISDTYAFVSYDETNLAAVPADRKVTFIMNVIPGQDPADGPNYFAFGDDVLYEINVDNDADGKAGDVVYQFRFTTENRPLGGVLDTPLAFVGGSLQSHHAGHYRARRAGVGRDHPAADLHRDRGPRPFADGAVPQPEAHCRAIQCRPEHHGRPGRHAGLRKPGAQGVYEDGDVRVFAGQRAETFYIDLGAVFDTVNLRRTVPALSPTEDANDAADPFGVNRFSGANVNTIAIEVPISRITDDRAGPDDTDQPVIGVYASTSRQAVRILNGTGRPRTSASTRSIAGCFTSKRPA